MENAIEVKGLTKQYKNFLLDNISFNVPKGYVCGFIGQNGAGKTTTLKLLLGMAIKDAGETTILGKCCGNVSIKEDLGILFDQPFFQEDWTPIRVEKALKPFYPHWDSESFYKYLQKFSIEPKQKFKSLSRGNKMKLGLAAALSHNARLLILDEPTASLDPVMRDQLMDILRDYMMEEDRSIFFSSHITSDLEKIADYIVYIHKGQIMYSGPKHELTEKYCIIRGGKVDLPRLHGRAALEESDQPRGKQGDIIGYREHIGGFDGLIEVSKLSGFGADIVAEPASLDDIMVCMDREGVL